MPSSFYGPKILPVANGGGTIELDIPQGGTLWYVGVAPDDTSVPETSVLVDVLDINDNWKGQVLGLGVASSDATYTHAHFSSDEVRLPDDERIKLRAVIYNLTGASVKWRLVAIVEVKE